MRRAANGSAFAAEEDVAVAAHAGVARPFVAGQADETARRVEFRRQPVELGPERVGDLKVVALVADDVDEGSIARVAEIALRRAHADGLSALPVQIAPIASQRRVGGDAHRIGAGKLLAVRHEPQFEIAGGVGHEIFQHARAVAGLDRDALRQAAHRPRRHERDDLVGLRGRIAPHVLGDDGEAERLAGDRKRGPDRLPLRRRARHQREAGLLGQLGEFVGGEGIDRGLELDALLAIGLQAEAGRALPAVAQPHGERVAGAQIAAADANEQRVRRTAGC